MRLVVDNMLRLSLNEDEADFGDQIRKDLRLTNPGYLLARRLGKDTRRMPRFFELAKGKENEIEVPRGYRRRLWQKMRSDGIELEAVEDLRSEGEAYEFNFNGELRSYQQDAVDRAISARDGVLCAPTGSGKTIIAMGIIAQLARKALVLVHTTALLQQTAERIRKFLEVEPGLVGGGHESLGPVTVATIQTLMRRPEDFLTESVGVVILDEAHHCPANTFRKVLQRFPAGHRIGLTATPERKDQLHPILYATAGPIFHRVDPEILRDRGAILRLDLEEILSNFSFDYEGNHTELLEAMINDADRNALIIDSVLKIHRRQSLVLTDRVAHAFHLAEELGSVLGNRVGVVVGETPPNLREEIFSDLENGRLDILIATATLVGEGFDCPGLDALFLCTPTGNESRLTQLIGRILRPHPDKPRPLVVDFVDPNIPVLARQSERRRQVYAEHRWRPEHDERSGVLL